MKIINNSDLNKRRLTLGMLLNSKSFLNYSTQKSVTKYWWVPDQDISKQGAYFSSYKQKNPRIV
ncbi:hypothetical protein SAMN05518672_108133 [Chitinophaga sp. CF118]|nr:hypothetical protein SAMN05518672_108133 [Chitinophaga sp. CF118]